jgi:LysM repeat protein
MRSFFTLLTIFAFVTAHAFSPTDSVGISTIGGVLVIIHKVDKGEGLLAISRRYNVTIDDIKKVNPQLKTLSVGQKVKIPYTLKTPVDSTKITIDEAHANADSREVPSTKIHVVIQGETISKIASKYKISPQQLIKWNTIKNNSISIGQELKVSGNVDIKPFEKWNKSNSNSMKVDSPKNILSSNTRQIEENGLVMQTSKTTHPSLAIGSFFICVSPDNQKQLLLKVEVNEPLHANCIIGLSKESIEKLGLDLNIPITIKYNIP